MENVNEYFTQVVIGNARSMTFLLCIPLLTAIPIRLSLPFPPLIEPAAMPAIHFAEKEFILRAAAIFPTIHILPPKTQLLRLLIILCTDDRFMRSRIIILWQFPVVLHFPKRQRHRRITLLQQTIPDIPFIGQNQIDRPFAPPAIGIMLIHVLCDNMLPHPG